MTHRAEGHDPERIGMPLHSDNTSTTMTPNTMHPNDMDLEGLGKAHEPTVAFNDNENEGAGDARTDERITFYVKASGFAASREEDIGQHDGDEGAGAR